MISSNFLASHILPMIIFHLLLATQLTSSVRTGHRATLSRTYYSGRTWFNFPFPNPWNNNPPALPIQSLLKAKNDLYIMTLTIGTPPVTFSGVLDTGSDLIWTKCDSSTGLDSVFDPSNSTSFFDVHETFKQKYADGLSVNGTLGQEILSIAENVFKKITFGCGQPDDDHDNYDGIIGMGRGDPSLISQLNERFFSYCLGSRSDPETSGVFLTGSKARNEINGVQTTPLIEHEGKTLYYISLEGISVGETRFPVTNSDFAISNGDVEMIIDSGATLTYLDQRIIDMISNEFMNQTKLEKCNDTITPYALEHCFMYQGYDKNQAPKLVFHFKGADWELPLENYIYEKQGEGGYLAFMSTSDSDDQFYFGNIMQQNMMVIYDLDQNILFFKHAICNGY
ncbi:aspartic proteinase nepenthesin-1-like [Bidens hawaiensis]|uniref:aspartic proteinase nepenthesin-1-like n=1 Tax=Bidens hawaiensis TaxID=980011 RepID=UPI00404B473B